MRFFTVEIVFLSEFKISEIKTEKLWCWGILNLIPVVLVLIPVVSRSFSSEMRTDILDF